MSGKTSLNQGQIKEAIKRYNNGESTEEIGNYFSKHRSTIADILIRNGVKMSQKGGYKQTKAEKEQQIISAYMSGMGATSVAREFEVSKKTVYNILRRAGIGTRPVSNRTGDDYKLSDAQQRFVDRKRKGPSKHNQLPLWEEAFDELTPDACYWIGFLMADGCVSLTATKSPRLMCQLAHVDIGHLIKLQTFLKCKNKITVADHLSYGKKHKHARFQVTSKKVCNKLKGYGIAPNKTGKEKAPEELKNNRDFWRGYIDGDGWIFKTGHGIGISGSEEINKQFQKFAGWDYAITEQPGCFVTKKRNCQPLIKKLYAGAETYLDRKMFLALLSM